MKRSNTVIAIIVVVVVAVAGYAIFHKSPSKSTTTASTAATSAPAVNNSVLLTKTDTSAGQYLTDPSGKPLYTYNADTSGVSNCTGSCLASWPAYQATGSTSNLPSGVGTIKRSDNGQTQYTYNGLPLYYFVSDAAGKAPTGSGVDNFAIARPATSAASSSSSSGSSSTSSSSGYNY